MQYNISIFTQLTSHYVEFKADKFINAVELAYYEHG